MVWARYELDFNSDAFKRRVNNGLASGVEVTEVRTARRNIVSFNLSSGGTTNRDDLSAALDDIGFVPLGTNGETTGRADWGVFDVATAPTSGDGALTGDEGFCTDGLTGLPTPVYFDGTDWLATVSGSIIVAASTGPISTAFVFDGGLFVGATDGDYTATQASTSGSGTGSEFTVTVASNLVTAVVSIDSAGTGYAPGDTVNLVVSGTGGTQSSDPVLTVIGIS